MGGAERGGGGAERGSCIPPVAESPAAVAPEPAAASDVERRAWQLRRRDGWGWQQAPSFSRRGWLLVPPCWGRAEAPAAPPALSAAAAAGGGRRHPGRGAPRLQRGEGAGQGRAGGALSAKGRAGVSGPVNRDLGMETSTDQALELALSAEGYFLIQLHPKVTSGMLLELERRDERQGL